MRALTAAYTMYAAVTFTTSVVYSVHFDKFDDLRSTISKEYNKKWYMLTKLVMCRLFCVSE